MTLEEQYQQAQISPGHFPKVKNAADTLCAYAAAYMLVARKALVPWWCIGAIHSLEAHFNFRCHLHNGDPLIDRTVHVPRGRPVAPPENGQLPYTWVESAIDALSTTWRPGHGVWTAAISLEFLERYNGLGYRQMGVPSPYLWSFTDRYASGLFTSDGKYDPLRISLNIGGAAIFKALEARGTLLSTTL